jgi:Undecaprenyl-phosphate glucose phosphotransferase
LFITTAKILAAEFFGVVCAALAASIIYDWTILLAWSSMREYIGGAAAVAMLVLIITVASKHFAELQTKPLHVLLWSGVTSVGLAFSLLMSIIFLIKVSGYSRGIFVCQFVGVAMTIVAMRAVWHSWLLSAIASGRIAARRVVLIGDKDNCAQLAARLERIGVRTVGAFRFPSSGIIGMEGGARADKREIREIRELCRRIRPDDLLILARERALPLTMEVMRAFSELPFRLHIVPVGALEVLTVGQIGQFGDLVTIQIPPPLSLTDQFTKRTCDIVLAAIGLVVFCPLFLIVAAALKLDSPGPVFFRQRRHGFNNEVIKVFKFRSMRTAESVSNDTDFKQAKRDDPRVTRIGRVLRRTNIDELPQLVNILMGDMSVVGPRPHATAHNDMYQERISPYSRRHNVKPGLTGWAQVNGFRGETDTLQKMQQRIELDLYYIDHWSLLFDFKIILLTLFSKTSYKNAY